MRVCLSVRNEACTPPILEFCWRNEVTHPQTRLIRFLLVFFLYSFSIITILIRYIRRVTWAPVVQTIDFTGQFGDDDDDNLHLQSMDMSVLQQHAHCAFQKTKKVTGAHFFSENR